MEKLGLSAEKISNGVISRIFSHPSANKSFKGFVGGIAGKTVAGSASADKIHALHSAGKHKDLNNFVAMVNKTIPKLQKTSGYNMNQEMLEKIAQEAFNDELQKMQKKAGLVSEIIGSAVNPLNVFGGNLIGSVAAAVTPTYNAREKEEAAKATWSNILVPGMGVHRLWKRLGHSASEDRKILDKAHEHKKD